MTDREIVEADLRDLYLGNLGTIEFDVELPTKGKHGSTISWESDMPHFLAADGRVSRPSFGRGNRDVTLSATFSYGDATETRTYHAQVLEADAEFKAVGVRPVSIRAVVGKPCRLPGYVAADTDDGRCLSLAVSWDGGSERTWGAPGAQEARGTVLAGGLPFTARVEVLPGPDAADAPERRARLATLGGHARLLGDTDFSRAQERMHAWLRGTDPNQFLYNFRSAAGLPTEGASPMTGWDSPDGLLRGHTTGHYLSALAKCWQATGDEEILAKARAMVDGLAACQRGLEARGCAHGFLSAYDEGQFDDLERYVPYPKIWAPYYTLHKILAGLLDLAQLAGLEGALVLATGIGEWCEARLTRLPAEQLARMWSIYIAGEYGGMNEALARLAVATGRPEFADVARLFDNDRLFFPLEQGVDALDGMHANQHIPQAIGAMELYAATGDRRYETIASRFWDVVTKSHTYAIGGTGESEMFHAPGAIASLLTASTCESCASYNMLKLTGMLHCREPRAAYMDYYEHTLFGHTIATCDHDVTGGTTYFISMLPAAHKDIDANENSCCHGTGLEQPSMYADHVFHALGSVEDPDAVLVDLFIDSELRLERAGIFVRQRVDAADPGRVRLDVEAAKRLELMVRVPSWCDGEPALAVDDEVVQASVRDGYLELEIEAGTRSVDLRMPCRPRAVAAPDDSSRYVVFLGPWSMVALSDRATVPELPIAEVPDLSAAEGRPLELSLPDGTRLVPFARVTHEAYHMYLKDPRG